MSELRFNPLTGEWVIIAPRRGERPRPSVPSRGRRGVASYEPGCPFCPGNEALTTRPVLELPDPVSPGRWLVRVVPNMYPAVGGEPGRDAGGASSLFVAQPAEGAHEVIIETPFHNREPAEWSRPEFCVVLEAYAARFEALLQRPGSAYATLFKNHGSESGHSLAHSHSQIAALPIVPDLVRRRLARSAQHYAATGNCLMCDVLNAELEAKVRVAHANPDFAVIQPYAAAYPAETWIVPRRHQAFFWELTAAERAALAGVLRRTLRQLRRGFDAPDFNYLFHSAPVAEASRSCQHWYIQIVPRLARFGGFELATGVTINSQPPEDTAETLRRAGA